jgi:hypothetical protein
MLERVNSLGASDIFIGMVRGDGSAVLQIDTGNTRTKVVDLSTFGAIGDGVTDTTTALQAALASGEYVIVHAGTYIFSATLTCSSYLELDCEPGVVFKAKASTDFNASLDGTDLTDVRIYGLTIDVNGPNRTGNANALSGPYFVNPTDFYFENCTVLRTRGNGSASAVGFTVSGASRVFYRSTKVLEAGDVGHISDCYYSNGERISYSDAIAEPTDTGFVFENASQSGGVNLRINGTAAGAGLAISCAQNADVRDLFFDDVIIKGCIAPIELGKFGAASLTGNLIGCKLTNVTVDCPDASFPTVFFYPNVGTNPGTTIAAGSDGAALPQATINVASTTNLAASGQVAIQVGGAPTIVTYTGKTSNTLTGCTGGSGTLHTSQPILQQYQGRVKGVTLDNFDIVSNGGALTNYGAYVSNADDVAIRNWRGTITDAFVDVEPGCTNVVVVDNDLTMGAGAIFSTILRDGCDDVLFARNRIHGGAAMAWGFYAFGTSTNIRTPDNVITGASLIDQEGIGADATTAPRSVKDISKRTSQPASSGTGIWPAGYWIFDVSNGTAGRLGWQVTTAGVPGGAVVFQKLDSIRTDGTTGLYGNHQFRTAGTYVGPTTVVPTARLHIEAQTTSASTAPIKLGNGGSLQTTAEDGSFEYSSELYFSKSTTRYWLTGWQKDSNGGTTATNWGFGGASTATIALKVYSNGKALCIQRLSGSGTAAIVFDDAGNYAFIDYDTVAANGMRLSALSKIILGTNTNAGYGSSTFTPAIRISATGSYFGPSVVNATAQIHIEGQTTAAGSAPLKFSNAASVMTTPEDGAAEYAGGIFRLTSNISGSAVRYVVPLATLKVTIDPSAAGAIGSLSQASTTVAVTGAAVGDEVAILYDASGPDAGTVWTAFVSAAGTVKLRGSNYTAAPITHASVTWNVVVRKAM